MKTVPFLFPGAYPSRELLSCYLTPLFPHLCCRRQAGERSSVARYRECFVWPFGGSSDGFHRSDHTRDVALPLSYIKTRRQRDDGQDPVSVRSNAPPKEGVNVISVVVPENPPDALRHDPRNADSVGYGNEQACEQFGRNPLLRSTSTSD